MTKAKYKMTGCARFFIFLILFAPIAYFGASYINGGDPVGDIKKLIESVRGDADDTSDRQDEEIKILEEENETLREENERLKNQLENLE